MACFAMPHRPKKNKKSDSKAASAADGQHRANQIAAQRRMEMATRSALSRFQNRSSERK
jgi:hypothetical protein